LEVSVTENKKEKLY